MFDKLRQQVNRRFDELAKTGNLLHVEVDRDKIWDVYLGAIPEEHRQSNNCNCCKSFLRQFGGVVAIDGNNKLLTLWDFEIEDPEYAEAVKALRRYVATLRIVGPFYHSESKLGTEKNLDIKRNFTWTHFYATLPNSRVHQSPGPLIGKAVAAHNVFLRALTEIPLSATETVLDLINQGLYRGVENKKTVESFLKAQVKFLSLKGEAARSNFCWSSKENEAVKHIRNSSIGTLLVDIAAGLDLDQAVRKYEAVVAPSNYKRTTSLVTPRMLEDARKKVVDLGLTSALNRRLLTEKDLTAENAVHVYRPKTKAKDVFEQLVKDTTVNPRSLSRVEEVHIEKFLQDVLPTARSVKVLLENSHLPKFAALVGPSEPSTGRLFAWDNDFSWSYSGEVADSVKSKVKAAGGNVSGFARISLSWSNFDDLDLSMVEPNSHRVYYMNKGQLSPSGAILDVDMNVSPSTRQPVENISWQNPPKLEGTYDVYVTNFTYRESSDTGFNVEMELPNGEVRNFHFPHNGSAKKVHKVFSFTYTHKNGFVVEGGDSNHNHYPSQEKWGLKTGVFHQVRAITLSPNHWNTKTGSKHYFFLLEGCSPSDKIRPFYNEFLNPALRDNRKALELLSSRLEVETPVGDPLAGLGFHETTRDHLYVEVDGSFKRKLKVLF